MSNLTPRSNRFEQNLIINGNIDFAQRGDTFTAMATGSFPADRLKI